MQCNISKIYGTRPDGTGMCGAVSGNESGGRVMVVVVVVVGYGCF